MAKTIHTLAYMVTADTRQFAEGMVLTRKELNLAKHVINESVSTNDRYAMSLAALQGLHAKGGIDAKQLAFATDKLNEEFAETATLVHELVPLKTQLANRLATINPLTVAFAAGAAGWAAGLALVSAATVITVRNIGDQIEKIDDLIASAATIGVAANSFQAMGHAAALADIEIGAMSKGIESMLGAISKGAGGSTKLVKVFDLMGLDAGSLKELRPEEQLLKITAALDGMSNKADQVRASMAIFGSADFLRLDADQIEHATKMLDEMGGGLSSLDVAVFAEFDDAVVDMNASLDTSWKRLTMAVIPSLTVAADAATDWVVAMNRSEEFSDTLEGIGSTLTVIAAVTKELPGVTISWLSSLEAANPKLMLLMRAAEMVGGAVGNPFSDIVDAQKQGRALDAHLAGMGGESQEIAILEESTEAAKEYAKQLEHIADAAIKLGQTGGNLVRSLQMQIATFSMTSREAKLFEAAASGASIGELVLAASLDKTLTEMEKRKKLTEDMASALKATKDDMASALKAARSPEEKFRDEVLKLRDAYLKEIITGAEYIKLRDKAAEGLTSRGDRPAGVNPMMEGSSAAESFLAEMRVRGTGKEEKEERMLKALASIDKHIVEGKVAVPTVVPRLGGA